MGLIDYDFQIITVDTFEAKIPLEFKHRLLKFIFNQTRKAVMKKRGITIKETADSLNEFEALPQFKKLIKTAVKTPVNNMFKQVAADGISVIDHYVDKAIYKRDLDNSKKWTVEIIIKGTYIDKR